MSYLMRYWSAPVVSGTSPIIFVGATSKGNSSTSNQSMSLTSLTGGTDSQPSEGDLVVVIAARAALGSPLSANSMVSTGYTTWVSDHFTGSDANVAMMIAAKRMGSSPDTVAVLTGSGNSSFGQAIIVQVWRGVDATTPLDVAVQTAHQDGSLVPNPPSITPVTSGAMIVAAGAATHSGVVAFSPPADLANFRQAVSPNTSFDARVGAGSAPWPGGAFDPDVWGNPDPVGEWFAASVALRPA